MFLQIIVGFVNQIVEDFLKKLDRIYIRSGIRLIDFLIEFAMHLICISYAFYWHSICSLFALLKSACLFNKSTSTFIKNT